MRREDLIAALSDGLPDVLAQDLIDNFLALRQDVVTGTLGRASPGKLVETLVQIMQFLDSGAYEQNPGVDAYLRSIESRQSRLGDGVRICAARIGRAMYALRNKRNVAHKAEVDPNMFDLRFLHHAAQWIVAELLRTVSGVPMEEAGKLVEMIQAPAGGLVEDFGDRRLVLEQMTSRDEALVLLHSHYPDAVPVGDVARSMDRFAERTVRNTLRELWQDKLVQGDTKAGYRLTRRGFSEAIQVYKRRT